MSDQGKIMAILGLGTGRRKAGRLTPTEVAELFRRGLPARVGIQVIDYFELNAAHVQRLLGTSITTLRRAVRLRRRLTSTQSDRLYRFVRVGLRAEDVLENREKAHAWLKTPRRALGHVAPIDLLDTDAGAREVENLLGRIEHGIVT